MNKAIVKVGRLGRSHGLLGEIKVRIEDQYLDDVLSADSLLVEISGQHIPYFVEAWRSGGALLKLEEVDNKETATLLQHKDIYFPEHQLSQASSPVEDTTPYDQWISWTIYDVEMGQIGTISGIVDLPEHYLAEVEYQGKIVMIPLHKNLITKSTVAKKELWMDLPAGLLEL